MLQDALHAAQTSGAHGAAAIRDTVARVFSGAEYARSTERTIGSVVWNWFVGVLESIVELLRGSASARSIALWFVFGLVALIIARLIYVMVQRGQLTAQHGAARVRQQGAATDPWLAAEQAANAGQYTDAAHHLYAALLQSLARQERLRLHPSKTAGDYVRELRARSSPSFTVFRGFVRAFEFVAYGHRECDAAQFAQLRALAEPLAHRANAA